MRIRQQSLWPFRRKGFICKAGITLLALYTCTGNIVHGEITLSAQSLTTNGLRLEGLRFALGSSKDQQHLQLSVDKIKLPQPFDLLSSFELQCLDFVLQSDGIVCRSGNMKIASPWLDAPQLTTQFQISKAQSSLTLDKLQIAGGSLQLTGHYHDGQWRTEFAARNLNAESVLRLPVLKSLTISNGKIDLQADGQGRGIVLEEMRAALQMRQLNAQSSDGKYAAEKLGLDTQLQGHLGNNTWQWRNRTQIRNGALYVDPVYIDAGKQTLELEANGTWLPQTQKLHVKDFVAIHQGVGKVTGHAQLQNATVQQAALTLQTEALEAVSTVYLKPFLAASEFEGIGVSGKLHAQAELTGQNVTRLHAEVARLNITDPQQRIALRNAAGTVHWAQNLPPEGSKLSWESMHFYKLPVGPSSLHFSAYRNSLRLDKPAELPLFDGTLRIGLFDWQRRAGTEPEVHFQGDIEHISLEKLTDALQWPPLSGQMSGHIPGMHYRDKRIEIDGILEARLFDGEVRIEDLQLAGLLEGFPQLSADIEVDNLDLQLITRRFAVGSIQGRLSGFIRDLELENWQPVTFYAWLGTPDNDDSKHRISQKAVSNLASISDGGAANLLSQTLLRAFDNFNYDRLGIGCYLHRGVCQLYGVEAAKQGFYIVKGGGLPRIDVIGYNSRIDWQTLLQRLRRVLATDKAIIQ